jgi:hypothetical protein
MVKKDLYRISSISNHSTWSTTSPRLARPSEPFGPAQLDEQRHGHGPAGTTWKLDMRWELARVVHAWSKKKVREALSFFFTMQFGGGLRDVHVFWFHHCSPTQSPLITWFPNDSSKWKMSGFHSFQSKHWAVSSHLAQYPYVSTMLKQMVTPIIMFSLNTKTLREGKFSFNTEEKRYNPPPKTSTHKPMKPWSEKDSINPGPLLQITKITKQKPTPNTKITKITKKRSLCFKPWHVLPGDFLRHYMQHSI